MKCEEGLIFFLNSYIQNIETLTFELLSATYFVHQIPRKSQSGKNSIEFSINCFLYKAFIGWKHLWTDNWNITD